MVALKSSTNSHGVRITVVASVALIQEGQI